MFYPLYEWSPQWNVLPPPPRFSITHLEDYGLWVPAAPADYPGPSGMWLTDKSKTLTELGFKGKVGKIWHVETYFAVLRIIVPPPSCFHFPSSPSSISSLFIFHLVSWFLYNPPPPQVPVIFDNRPWRINVRRDDGRILKVGEGGGRKQL